MNKVELATYVAKIAHAGQIRNYGGVEYVTHPIAVANIVKQYTKDEDVIVAALLHDVVEDCDVTLELVEEQFGPLVAHYVRGVTKVSSLEDGNRAARRKLDHEHFARQCSECQLIKAADSLHNMGDIGIAPDGFRKRYVPEKRQLAGMLTSAPEKLVEDLLATCDKFDY